MPALQIPASPMLAIVLTIIPLIYLLYLMETTRNIFSIKATKILRVVLLIGAALLMTCLFLKPHNIYPRSYWTMRILFWIVVFSMMILFSLGNKSALYKGERIIYKVIFYLPLAFTPFLLVPFLGIAYALLFYVSFIGDRSMIVYADQEIRIEQPYIRFMGPDPPLEIYRKKGFFSCRDTTLRIHYNDRNDKLSVLKPDDSTYVLGHYSPDNWQVPTGFEEFRFTLRRE